MDWDEIKTPPIMTFAIGDDLTTLSIGELEARIAALQAEVARVSAELDAKRVRTAAADQLFKR